MSEVDTSPHKVGTIRVEAVGNFENGDKLARYVFTIVDLPECTEGEIQFEQQDVLPSDTKVSYSYTYPVGQPLVGASIKPYALPVFLPVAFNNQAYIPEAIEVYNAEKPDERKTGKVRMNNPVIRDLTNDGVIVHYDVPRYFVAAAQVVNFPQSAITFYFVFIISKTTSNNERVMDYSTSGAAIICDYNTALLQTPNPENRAAVVVVPSNQSGQYNSAQVNNGTIVPISLEDYHNPELFYYDEIPATS